MRGSKTLDPIAVGIRRIMIEKGYMQKAVAKRAGYSEQQFSDMLNDRKIIRAIDLVNIADALAVEVADIYAAAPHDPR